MKKLLTKISIPRHEEDGFSLLELVIAVGILLVLTVGGLLSYSGIMNNARQAAIQSEVNSISTMGAAYLADNDENTGMCQSIVEWAKSANYYYAFGSSDSEITTECTNKNIAMFYISTEQIPTTAGYDIYTDENVVYIGQYINKIEDLNAEGTLGETSNKTGVYLLMYKVNWIKNLDGSMSMGTPEIIAKRG